MPKLRRSLIPIFDITFEELAKYNIIDGRQELAWIEYS